MPRSIILFVSAFFPICEGAFFQDFLRGAISLHSTSKYVFFGDRNVEEELKQDAYERRCKRGILSRDHNEEYWP